jgi:hypothetical protein
VSEAKSSVPFEGAWRNWSGLRSLRGTGMKSLCRRVSVLEERSRTTGNGRHSIQLRFAERRLLPRDYVGERHEVLVRGWPAETAARSEALVQIRMRYDIVCTPPCQCSRLGSGSERRVP